jgi:hypothetical protein
MLPFLIFAICGAAIAFFSGADASFDYLNYHLYNGWATLRDSSSDFLPTSIWTYFPSQLDFIYYQIWSNFPTIVLCIFFGGFQGLIGYLVYEIVQKFESRENHNNLSYKGIFFGVLAISSPLVRAQFGNSMHDLTLSVIEFYIVKKIVFLDSGNSVKTLRFAAILLGLTLALKPSHLIFVLVVGVFMILRPRFIEKILLFGMAVTSFVVFSFPWIVRSFLDTKSLFFPYLASDKSGFLSGSPILHSYEDWKIKNLNDFLVHLLYPGGSSRINHEINFMDVTVPVVITLFVFILFVKFTNSGFSQKRIPLQAATTLFCLGIAIYMINQLVFTGVRYSIVIFPLMITALALVSCAKESRVQVLTFLCTLVIIFTNFLLPDSIFLPTRQDSISVSSVPDYGRTNHTFFNPQRKGFISPYELDRQDLLILGQEQISFVAPLWNTDAKIMGLQAYILGENAKRRMQNMINEEIGQGRGAYLVTLRQNTLTMENQLKAVDSSFGISECIPVLNPFRRDVVICMVKKRANL